MSRVDIKDAFAKGFIDGYGRNKLPGQFATYLRNARIDNKTITIRPGTKTIISNSEGTYIKALTYNDVNNKILCASDSKLKLVNLTAFTLDDIGVIGTDNLVNMFNHGKYTIILTGISKPYVYDGTTLTLTSTTAPDVNPIIGTAFSGFTVLAGNTTATSNYIYFSRPITPTNPERAYDWMGSGSENRNMQSKVVGLLGSLNNLFIRTEKTVEYVNKDSLATIGSTFSFYSSPIGEGDILLNSRCAVAANDLAFYMTKDFTIKTLNYVPGTIDPAIGQLSDRPLISIKNFLKTRLNDNQDSAFACRKDDKVFWYLRSYNNTINDIAVIYDITNDSRLVDDNINYSSLIKVGNSYYSGSMIASDIIQDETGFDDDGEGIPFEYHTIYYHFGTPVKRKFFKGRELAGELNRFTKLEIDTQIDGNVINNAIIDGSVFTDSLVGDNIGGAEIGGEPIGGDISNYTDDIVPFEKVNDEGGINLKGKNIMLSIKNNQSGAKFYLDFLSFNVKPIGNYTLSDKI